ncbi:hypothetical protein [Streptomyces sp. NPDC056785]|uniref:hypothetical protein n=1 Tax=Streptomyces sp. NPDC056785 TaxID=3345944 RepID=UPI00368BF687
MLVAAVALGAVVVVILLAGGGDDKPGKKGPAGSTGGTASSPSPSLNLPSGLPSRLPSELPSELPSGLPSGLPSELPSGLPSGLLSGLPSDLSSGLQSLVPDLADEVPYYMLTTGDCFDTSEARPGQAAKRRCGTPHDAEVVKVAELDGAYSTDAALKKAASALCEAPLERKAARQSSGTVRGTLVQYPDPDTYGTGIDKVTCSLAADIGDGTHRLTAPLT